MTTATLNAVDTIALHHWNEWQTSAVSDHIISRNVRTIYDARELDKILNRNSKKRWKHSDQLVPAWYASGVDPLTDEPTLQGVQVKPDTSPIGTDGRIQKYLSAKDFESSPLFLNTGIEGYWKSIIDDILKAIIITEGAKKAGAGLSIGIPTISIPGVATCRKKGRLHQLLDIFAVLGRTFYLCFDNDILKKQPVQKALIGLAKELSAKGSKVMVVMLPEGAAKGMDDYIALHGADAFKELIDKALTFEEWKEEIDSRSDDSESPKKSKLSRSFHLIQQHWGESLRYNTLKKRVELHGTELAADDVRLVAALEFDMDISTTDAHTIVRKIARDNAYSPVVDYLDEMESKFPGIDPSFLDGLAQEYFGTSDPMHSIYMKKFLVSSVARARQPGCKCDSVFMLASPKQGLYKSTFFRLLFGDDWFSDQLGDANDKDEKMKMHRYWCLEWAEFETVYKRKDIATLKNFITSVEDTFRAPYDRDMVTYQRPCVFVGTTNEQEILNDPTGDRRFWIVPVIKKIPILQVVRDKDKIWAAANALYKSGFEWKLTDEEEARRETLNREYHSIDPWQEVLETQLANSPFTKFIATETLYEWIGLEPSKRTGAEARRISSVMRRLGWYPERSKVNGVWRRGWCLEKNSTEIFAQNTDLSGSSGSTSETLAAQGLNSDPDKKLHLDLSGSKGSDLLDVSNITERNLIPEIQIDPDTKTHLDQLESAPCLGDPDDPDKTPSRAKNHNSKIYFEENHVYWHPQRQRRVKVKKIVKSKQEADVVFGGDIETVRVSLSELTEVPTPLLKPGDQVEVIFGKHEGLKLVVSSVDPDTGIWLKKPKGFSLPYGPFEERHLRKL